VPDLDSPSPTPSRETEASVRGNLKLRVASALVLAPMAIAAAYLGGVIFVGFWAVAALGIQWEWRRIVADTNPITLALGIGAILFVAIELGTTNGPMSLVDLSVTAGAVAAAFLFASLTARQARLWTAGGILYASALLLAVGVLRSDRKLGFSALVFLFAVVWATDILAYFVGRLVGGPKLSPKLSPKKTWSGAVGGAIAAAVAGLAATRYSIVSNSLAIVCLALLLSAVSQVGDLFESAMKRRFGIKDAGDVIPGHGGFMDRLDGFLAAALAAAIIGLARGGTETPAGGLLVW
jgi:phosphatidate cytidylyltransferase